MMATLSRKTVKIADANTGLAAYGGAHPADPSNEGSLVKNNSSLLKHNQDSSAHNSDLYTPDLLGSKSPQVEISQRRNSN